MVLAIAIVFTMYKKRLSILFLAGVLMKLLTKKIEMKEVEKSHSGSNHKRNSPDFLFGVLGAS